MDLGQALTWARARQHGTLITIRKDGRPQSSDIAYAMDGEHFLISITEGRAKTANLRRDARAVMHLSDPSAWSYLSFDGTVELSPVTNSTTDTTCDQLVTYFETITGSAHPDWDEYRRAMVAERRLLARFVPRSVVGQLN